jgi:hypothetical protein
MPKRIVRLLPNGRRVTWGCFFVSDRVTAIIAEGETDILRVELNEWLDSGETIASSALAEQTGVTITKANNTTSVDLTISGVTWEGEAMLSITTSAGRVRKLGLTFAVPEAAQPSDHWRSVAYCGW